MTLPNGVAILDKNTEKTTDWTPGPFNAFAALGDVSEPLGMVPFQAANLLDMQPNYPKWFKIRAELWSEQKIPNKIYFDGIEALLRIGIIK
jgi:hypothetical protein